MTNKIFAVIALSLLLVTLVAGCISSVPKECKEEHKYTQDCIKGCKDEADGDKEVIYLCDELCNEEYEYDYCVAELEWDECVEKCDKKYDEFGEVYICRATCTEEYNEAW